MFTPSFADNAIVKAYSPDSANSDVEGYVTIIPNFKVNVQPAGPEYQLLAPQGEAGKIFRGFTTRSGIRENMFVVLSGTVTASGMRLKVIGVENFNGPLGFTSQLTLLKAQE